jgi:hypothetical protein
VFGFIIGGEMGAEPLSDPKWLAALAVMPVLAVSVFVWTAAHEHERRSVKLAAYIAVIIMPVIWLVLTQS